MPFIDPESRRNIDILGHKPITPGDRCYVWYRWMMEQWKRDRRWATADRIYRQMIIEPRLHDAAITDGFSQRVIEDVAAVELAWQVFFILQVMPYEEAKMEENGDIE